MRQGDGCSGCCPKGSGLVDSDGESEADVDNGVNGDAEYDIEGGDVDFWMEENNTFNVCSTFLRKMLSKRDQRVKLMEHVVI